MQNIKLLSTHCLFCHVDYLKTLKTLLLTKVDIILFVKWDIIIIVMNTDKKIIFVISNLQKIKRTHLRPALWTETY